MTTPVFLTPPEIARAIRHPFRHEWCTWVRHGVPNRPLCAGLRHGFSNDHVHRLQRRRERWRHNCDDPLRWDGESTLSDWRVRRLVVALSDNDARVGPVDDKQIL